MMPWKSRLILPKKIQLYNYRTLAAPKTQHTFQTSMRRTLMSLA
jgi:hypothetical protein